MPSAWFCAIENNWMKQTVSIYFKDGGKRFYFLFFLWFIVISKDLFLRNEGDIKNDYTITI